MAKPSITVELAPGLNSWAWSDPDEPFTLVAGGSHTIDGDEITDDLLRAIGGAVAAGSLILRSADASSRKTLEAVPEPDDESLKALAAADTVRAELLEERDQALNDIAADRADRLAEFDSDDEDAAKDEAARFNAVREQVLAAHDDRVDATLRSRLSGDDS